MKHLHLILLLGAFFLSSVQVNHGLLQRQDALTTVLNHINKEDVVRVREKLIKQTPFPQEQKKQMLDKMTKNTIPDYMSEKCSLCVTAVEYAYATIFLGLEYEDVRDVIIGVCEDVMTGSSGDNRSAQICPGTMDGQVPHVFNILKQTDMTEETACRFINFCSKDDFHPTEYSSSSYKLPPRIRDLQNADLTKRKDDVDMVSTIKILQITDIHVDHEYSEGAATDCGLPICCRNYWPGKGSATKYGSYACNLPPRTVELFIESVIKQQKIKPDLILYSGDNPPHSHWNETLDGQIKSSAYVASMLKKQFPDKLIYPTIGNHETYPTNIYYTELNESKVFTQNFAKMWKAGANFTPEQEKTLLKAGYYSSLIRPGLRLLSFNSNFGYTMNFYNILAKEEIPFREMRQFMENTLQAARDSGEKVILLNHHAIGRYDNILFYSYFLGDLCIRFKDTIVLFIGGHTHKDEFKLIRVGHTGETSLVQMIAPSVSPYDHINPSVRFYYLEPKSFILEDYAQYQLDLAKIEKTGEIPPAIYAYSAKYEYGMKDLSPGSWHHLADRMRTDEELFQKFYRHYFADSLTGQDAYCDFTCKVDTLCQVYEAPYDLYRQCVKTNGTNWLTKQMSNW